jgi:hypothetical protein
MPKQLSNYIRPLTNINKVVSGILPDCGRRTITRNLRLRPSITPKRHNDIPYNKYKLYKDVIEYGGCVAILAVPLYIIYKN